MSKPYRGSCLCGAVAFEVDEFTDKVGNCHCTMCRKFHGAAFATIAGVEKASFRWLRGEDALQGYTAANGTTRTFCRHCGSSLAFSSPRASDAVIEIALGAFDDELPVRPDAHIYVGFAANWVSIPADQTQYVEWRDSKQMSKS